MTTTLTICEHGVDIWAYACDQCPERPSYDHGVRWGVKHNTTGDSEGKYPYWIASLDSEERAKKFYEVEYQYAQRKYPNQPDKLPEIVRLDMIWTKVYP